MFKSYIVPVLLLALVCSSVSYADEITVKADMWCPFNCAPNSTNPGMFIEFMQKALEPAGHKVIYEELNWTRALEYVASGKITAVVGAYEAEVKENGLVTLPEVSLKTTNCFFASPDSKWTYTDIDSLKKIRLGVVQSYNYGLPELDAYIADKNNVSRLYVAHGNVPLEDNLRKLEAKGLDAFLEEKNVVANYLKSNPHIKLSTVKCLNDNTAFIAFSGKNPKANDYLKLISKKISELKKSGEYKKIEAKYGIK